MIPTKFDEREMQNAQSRFESIGFVTEIREMQVDLSVLASFGASKRRVRVLPISD
jgi:hypothetical protein